MRTQHALKPWVACGSCRFSRSRTRAFHSQLWLRRFRTASFAGLFLDRRNLVVTVSIKLKDGREVSRHVTSFNGTPERPLERAELLEKFLLLTQRLGRDTMAPLFDRLQAIENEKSLDWLNV